MIDQVRDIVKNRLGEGRVEGVIGLKLEHGQAAPCLFTKVDEVDSLVLSPKYPLSTLCRLIISKRPEARLGIVAFGCDERALVELAKANQVDLNRIEILGVACTEEQARECRCERPYPSQRLVGEKVEGAPDERGDELLGKSLENRYEFWTRQFNKCIKCYGCRNVCPMCFCKDCALEQAINVRRGELPPDFPIYHFIRAYDTIGRCIGCGECERACPMDIPLTTLYRLLRKDVKELFGYEAGLDVEKPIPLATILEYLKEGGSKE